MEIGIFSRTFPRPSVEEMMDAVVDHGIFAIQYNWPAGGPDDLPTAIALEDVPHVRQVCDERGIHIAAVSGTYNMIHPDAAVRAVGRGRLRQVIATAPGLGTRVVTLCTGTRDVNSMWRHHPDNDTDDAWRDLLASLEDALLAAEEHDVMLGVETEVNNVISSPAKARALLDTVRSPHLGIIMDGANVFPKGTLTRQHEILDQAFDLLGDDIVSAHAKDLSRDGDAGHEAAGTGLLDYDHYVKLLKQSQYDGAILLHSLSEAQAPGCIAFLRSKMER